MIEYMFDQLGGRRNQSQAARTKASRLLVEQLETRLVPSGVPLHYAANANFVNGQYVPAQDGFNLADASGLSEVNSLPAGDKALVWLGMGDGVTSAFTSAVQPFIGNAKVYGFYLVDEPDPTGQWGPLVNAPNLKAESDWIHANDPGAKTFIVLMNMGTETNPSFVNTYNSANTDIDLFGLDPYPVQTQFNGANYSIIAATVQAAEAWGIKQSQIVPVYQAFGDGVNWVMPTASQEQQILSTWAPLVPQPAFDYAYSWGVQNNDTALVGSPSLQTVFAAHNAAQVSPNQRFVFQVYQDLLGRQVDAPALASWTSSLNAGTARTQVVEIIEASVEYRTDEVKSYYQELLGRAADSSSLQGWVTFLGAGGTSKQLESMILGSDEFFANEGGGTVAGFLTALYQDVLNRAIDTTALQTWTRDLANGASRSTVALAVLRSLESDRDEVQSYYTRFLHRTADSPGLNTYVTDLLAGIRNEDIIAAIVGSAEYFNNTPK